MNFTASIAVARCPQLLLYNAVSHDPSTVLETSWRTKAVKGRYPAMHDETDGTSHLHDRMAAVVSGMPSRTATVRKKSFQRPASRTSPINHVVQSKKHGGNEAQAWNRSGWHADGTVARSVAVDAAPC